MSRRDQDAYTEPAFVPRSVVPQKFETPDEYLYFLKDNELTGDERSSAINGLARRSEITDKLLEFESFTKSSGTNDVSRTVYVWDFKSTDASSFPTILLRSKVVISDYSQKSLDVDHSLTIQLITNKPKKSLIHQPILPVEDVDEEDIFDDAGRDYVLAVDESYQSVHIQEEQDQFVELDIEREEIMLQEGIGNKRASEMVDTDMMDLDLDEIEYSNLGESASHQKKKLKTRSDFASEDAWRAYEETQALMLSTSRIGFEENSKKRRGGHRGGMRGSQRGAARGGRGSAGRQDKLDRELEAVDKVYQKKYGSGLK